jgi:hypothetical protein
MGGKVKWPILIDSENLHALRALRREPFFYNIRIKTSNRRIGKIRYMRANAGPLIDE